MLELAKEIVLVVDVILLVLLFAAYVSQFSASQKSKETINVIYQDNVKIKSYLRKLYNSLHEENITEAEVNSEEFNNQMVEYLKTLQTKPTNH